MEAKRRQLAVDVSMYPTYAMAPTTPTQDVYGELKRWPVGSHWSDRNDCRIAGVHRQNQAGIAPGPRGAYSIVTSGHYGDQDEGDVLIYSGTGGQDSGFGSPTGRPTEDQSIDHPANQSLLKSIETKNPVRIIRGFKSKSKYAPVEGYRYDGLYEVKAWKTTKGPYGFNVCQFRLERLSNQKPLPPQAKPAPRQ